MKPMAHKVRVDVVYTFRACMTDVVLSQHHHCVNGQRVRVIQLPCAPKPNTMGQCHVADATTGEFLGMVSIYSLRKDE